MSEAPILFVWDGTAMRPRMGVHAKECDRRYVVGERYLLTEWQDRSGISHNHYFASITEAWKNLPDAYQEIYPTPEHLRKRALIATGWRTVQEYAATSKAEAERMAAFTRSADPYIVTTIVGTTTFVFHAVSQSMKAMGKKDFQKSKDDVLQWCADLIHVPPQQLVENAGRAA